MPTAFIIGNGKSRKGFDLTALMGHGTIYGCNALYREFYPDYLVAIDDPMIYEIRQSGFPEDRLIIPPYNEQFEESEHSYFQNRSNAGMIAMKESIKTGHTYLICFGFDFFLNGTNSYSNVFEGTHCYGKDTAINEEDSIRRMNYMGYIARKNPNVTFEFVLPMGVDIRKFSGNMPNVIGSFYDDYLERLYTVKCR
jgi:hypothetical protein